MALVQQLQKNVDITINKARNQVGTNPDLAAQTIGDQINTVSAATEPTPEEKDVMLRRLEAVRTDIGQRKLVFEHRRQQLLADNAARQERQMANASMLRDETKIYDLFQRMDYLMAESRHNEAEKAAELANDIAKVAPFPDAAPIATASINWTRFEGAWNDILMVRTAREKGFVDSLFQVERSSVPTADDPPIVYPDSEWWKEMSKRRKEKYGSMDLKIPSPTEKKIAEALKAASRRSSSSRRR